MKRQIILFLIIISFFIPITRGVQSGEIYGWGNNNFGQSTSPAGNDFIAVATGNSHSLALKTDGSIIGWGNNFRGQAVPPAGNGYIAIAAGGEHSLALKSDGTLVGWGLNKDQQATPPAGNDYIAIAAGVGHSLALKSNGTIVGWGQNDFGQAIPPAGNDYIAIAAGAWHNLALKSNGAIVGWGWNLFYQASPPAGNNYIAISAGAAHSVAIKSDHSIIQWGNDQNISTVPVIGNDYIAIDVGNVYNLALKADGTIVQWHNTNTGQVPPPIGTGFIAIDGAHSHCLAIRQTNQKPVADAGDNQAVFSGTDGMAWVQLDGTASFDPDGDVLEYFWYNDANDLIAAGAEPNVILPIGEHVITLIVNDGIIDSEPNDVLITVIGPMEAQMMFVPQVLNPKSCGRYVMVIITLPKGVMIEDLDENQPWRLLPGDIEALFSRTATLHRRQIVYAVFDRDELIDALDVQEQKFRPRRFWHGGWPNGTPVEITVYGKLDSGQVLFATDTICVIRPFKPAHKLHPLPNHNVKSSQTGTGVRQR